MGPAHKLCDSRLVDLNMRHWRMGTAPFDADATIDEPRGEAVLEILIGAIGKTPRARRPGPC